MIGEKTTYTFKEALFAIQECKNIHEIDDLAEIFGNQKKSFALMEAVLLSYYIATQRHKMHNV